MKRNKRVRKVLRIKWENIVTLIMTIVSTLCIVNHIAMQGLYSELVLEIAMYAMLTKGLSIGVEAIRTNK